MSLPSVAGLERLRSLIGRDALLLSWPEGSKGTKLKWGHLTASEMEKPEYQAQLLRGNIGVALGRVSGGLCCIDIDRNEAVEPFLAQNPVLRDSFTVVGARGCKIFVRIDGPCPRGRKFKGVGEWLSHGQQAIIHGTHPHGMHYRITVEQSPVRIAYDQIKWPAGESKGRGLTEGQGGVAGAPSPRPSAPSLPSLPSVPSVRFTSVEQFKAQCVPDTPHQNHAALFTFGRGILAVETNRGAKFSRAELQAAFDQWYAAAQPNGVLRDGQTKEEYWIEFYEAYRAAKYPLDEPDFDAAWELAKSEPLPPEAGRFETPELQLLVALLFQLQRAAGDAPFFLSCRKFPGLIGNRKSHETIAQWLRHLEFEGILQVVKKGGPETMKATRFRFRRLP